MHNELAKHDLTSEIQHRLLRVLTYPELSFWPTKSFLILLIRTCEVHRTILTALDYLIDKKHQITMFDQIKIC